jgi:hypothetical protein
LSGTVSSASQNKNGGALRRSPEGMKELKNNKEKCDEKDDEKAIKSDKKR